MKNNFKINSILAIENTIFVIKYIMDYQQTIDLLFLQLPMYQRIGKAAYKANLDNTLALDAHFNHPHKNFKTIHVAGTNGKGSVSYMLASIFQEAGLKTGLYTSPHLIDFRERIKVNGKMIEKDEVVGFVEENKAIIEKIKPSFFEMTVAMAFNYFAKQKVDIAVIEVGMGGRLDSTNIIKPLASIITNIGFDHVSYLGSTLEKIALEKAGIIKQRVPVIVGEEKKETASIFIDKAVSNDSSVCFSERRFKVRMLESSDEAKQEMIVKNVQSGTTFNISIDLLGEYQQKNIIPVFGALQVLTPLLNLPKHAIVSGLANVVKNTNIRGRWEVIKQSPKVICDTGHNAEGITCVINQLKKQTYNKLHIILGLVDDKDINTILGLFPKDAIYYFSQAAIPRAVSHTELYKVGVGLGLKGKSFDKVGKAYKQAFENAEPTDLIFVGGSTFVVADLLVFLENKL